MVEGLIGTVAQVGVVLIVCLVAWLIFGRRKASFRVWLGLTGAPPLLLLLCLALGVAGAWLLLRSPGVATLASGPGTTKCFSKPKARHSQSMADAASSYPMNGKMVAGACRAGLG